jgi:hypothetical protein
VYCDHFAFKDLAQTKHVGFDIKLRPSGGCESPPRAWKPNCELRLGVPVVPVRAAFGGLGVYRASKLRALSNCSYGTKSGCEHTPLNDCLFAAGAALWVVPALRVDWEGCSGPLRNADPGNYGRGGDPKETNVTWKRGITQ